MTLPGPVRLGTAGLWAIATALLCFLVTALLGPSAFEPAMDARFGEPPYSLDVHPSPYVVLGLVVAGVLAGTAGLASCFLAVRRGWRVRAFPLVVAGLLAAVAFMFMPPVGSTDHLNYASYGRMAATGHDPYETRAVDLPKDPVAGAPEEWRSTPSVYGPIATGEQAVSSWIGGGSVRLTVFVLSVFNVLAFAVTALILYRTSRDEERRLRTALLWTCNPLMLFHLISGAHNDVLAIAPMVAALTVFDSYASGGRWRMWGRAFAAGALTGAGAAIKMPAALVGGGPAWTLLREACRGTGAGEGRRARAVGGLVALFGGALAAAAAAYGLAGPHALDQVREASNMVSFATPWHLLDRVLGRGSQRDLIKTGSLVLGIVLFLLLARGLPKDDAQPGLPKDDALPGLPDSDALAGRRGEGVNRRMAAAFVLAWLLAAPYVLPWYDGFGWALLALLPMSRIDWILLAHTAALSLAYLPARAPQRIGMPHDMSWLFTVVRPTVIPWTLLAVLAALAVLCLRPGRSRASAPRPRASAGSPG